MASWRSTANAPAVGERIGSAAMPYGREQSLGKPERDERERRAPAAEPAPAERLLAFQRSAGNRAVGALLARSPNPAAPGDSKATETSGPHATLPGIGTIALLSVSLDADRASGRTAKELGNEIAVTSRQGPHSSLLSKAVLDGKPMHVEIVLPRGEGAIRSSSRARSSAATAPRGPQGT
jgi:hypothetical protein